MSLTVNEVWDFTLDLHDLVAKELGERGKQLETGSVKQGSVSLGRLGPLLGATHEQVAGRYLLFLRDQLFPGEGWHKLPANTRIVRGLVHLVEGVNFLLPRTHAFVQHLYFKLDDLGLDDHNVTSELVGRADAYLRRKGPTKRLLTAFSAYVGSKDSEQKKQDWDILESARRNVHAVIGALTGMRGPPMRTRERLEWAVKTPASEELYYDLRGDLRAAYTEWRDVDRPALVGILAAERVPFKKAFLTPARDIHTKYIKPAERVLRLDR